MHKRKKKLPQPQEVPKTSLKKKVITGTLIGAGVLTLGALICWKIKKSRSVAKEKKNKREDIDVPELETVSNYYSTTKREKCEKETVLRDAEKQYEQFTKYPVSDLNLTKMLYISSSKLKSFKEFYTKDSIFEEGVHIFQLFRDNSYYLKISFLIKTDESIKQLDKFGSLCSQISEIVKLDVSKSGYEELLVYVKSYDEDGTHLQNQFIPLPLNVINSLLKTKKVGNIFDICKKINNQKINLDKYLESDSDVVYNISSVSLNIEIPFRRRDSESGVDLDRGIEIIQLINSLEYDNFVFHPESSSVGNWNYFRVFSYDSSIDNFVISDLKRRRK